VGRSNTVATATIWPTSPEKRPYSKPPSIVLSPKERPSDHEAEEEYMMNPNQMGFNQGWKLWLSKRRMIYPYYCILKYLNVYG